MQGSEVAQLREKIELEIQAMRSGLTGYAAVSRHDIINRKYDQLGTYVEQLHQHIGKAKAMEVVINALDQWGHNPDKKSPH